MLNTLFLVLSFLTARAEVTLCADGHEASSKQTYCSQHGGRAGEDHYEIPTLSAPTSWGKTGGQLRYMYDANFIPYALTWSVIIQSEDLYTSDNSTYWPVELSYTLFCGEDYDGGSNSQSIGGFLDIVVPSAFTTSLTEDENNVIVSFVNLESEITTVQSWDKYTSEGFTHLRKPIGRNTVLRTTPAATGEHRTSCCGGDPDYRRRAAGEPEKLLSVVELNKIMFADYVTVTALGSRNYVLNTQGLYKKMKIVADLCK